jgi:hypothetical protein
MAQIPVPVPMSTAFYPRIRIYASVYCTRLAYLYVLVKRRKVQLSVQAQSLNVMTR